MLTKPTSVAFVEVQHKAAVQTQVLVTLDMYLRELDLKSFNNRPVLRIYAQRFHQLGRLARALKPQGIALLEADVRPQERYLTERFITAGVQVHGGHLAHGVCTDCKPTPAPESHPLLKVMR